MKAFELLKSTSMSNHNSGDNIFVVPYMQRTTRAVAALLLLQLCVRCDFQRAIKVYDDNDDHREKRERERAAFRPIIPKRAPVMRRQCCGARVLKGAVIFS